MAERLNVFDTSVYAQYSKYLKKESLPGLDACSYCNVSTLLERVRQLGANNPPLIPRRFVDVNDHADSLRSSDHRFDGVGRETVDGDDVGRETVDGDDVGRETVSSDCVGKDSVRIMTWNLLAQGLSVGKDNFVQCPDEALRWENRRYHILEEILRFEADIVCLQEVDHYGLLAPILSAIGYSGKFFPKPDSPALKVADTNGPDGCAVFFKTPKLELVKQEAFVLEAEGQPTNSVCIVVVLRTCGGRELCVATTHLKARSGFHEWRRLQGDDLLRRLVSNYHPARLIVTGDFNAEPTEPVYSAFQSSQLRLSSAYKLLSPNGDREPPYTTWKIRGGPNGNVEVAHTIDYVWYSTEKFAVKALCGLPTGEELGVNRLPSRTYPSDHLALVVDFRLC